MKKLATVVILIILLVELLLLGSTNKDVSVADTSIPNDEVAGSIGNANNSSASATITITMTGIPNE